MLPTEEKKKCQLEVDLNNIQVWNRSFGCLKITLRVLVSLDDYDFPVHMLQLLKSISIINDNNNKKVQGM